MNEPSNSPEPVLVSRAPASRRPRIGLVLALLPHGLHDHSLRIAPLHRLVETWPAKPLWISAIRVGDGRLEWFGRDPDRADTVRPVDAVAASCAIPVLARPVRIGRHRYVDGGVKSATRCALSHTVDKMAST